MAWDNFNTDIDEAMPEWWKNAPLALPINRYTQEIIQKIIGSFLTSLSVTQPVQVWKTIPEEYHWIHSFTDSDSRLSSNKKLESNKPLYVSLPNTKRKTHAYIHLSLKGNNKNSDYIEKLSIRNHNQIIEFSNINTQTDIEIWTETNQILINGVRDDNLINGSLYYIEAEPRDAINDQLNVEDENKKTQLIITSTTEVEFDLDVEIFKPTYVTEQNIRVSTVSAFPIEWIKLYGFFCHDFNNKQEWKFLWEKHYNKADRVVYDRITKQYDVETFYIQVKFHGIGLPLSYGFPQEEYHSNPIFRTNDKLDYWGRIYQLPRRYYRNDITKEEEPFTFPKYYPYNIEQDYWYEQRIVNEYKQEYENIDTVFIKDTNLNNIAILESIDPFMHDTWVYTETIPATRNNEFETDDIYPSIVTEIESSDGLNWTEPGNISSQYINKAEIKLDKEYSDSLNNYLNVAKILNVKFPEINLPKNIEITGIALKIEGQTDYHSNALEIDDRSFMYLKYKQDEDETIEQIPIKTTTQEWNKGQGEYTIGGRYYTFGVDIQRYQLIDGIEFDIGFTNTNEYLVSNISIYNIRLCIYYKKINDAYELTTEIDKRKILLKEDNKEINLLLNLKNTGEIPIETKGIYIAVPPELDITNNEFSFSLDVDEEFTIGKLETDKITITPHKENEKYTTGYFDIIIFCDNKVIKEEILVKQGGIDE